MNLQTIEDNEISQRGPEDVLRHLSKCALHTTRFELLVAVSTSAQFVE